MFNCIQTAIPSGDTSASHMYICPTVSAQENKRSHLVCRNVLTGCHFPFNRTWIQPSEPWKDPSIMPQATDAAPTTGSRWSHQYNSPEDAALRYLQTVPGTCSCDLALPAPSLFYFYLFVIHLSIHWLSLFIPCKVVGWSLSQPTLDNRRGTPWKSGQFITWLTYNDNHTHTLRFTSLVTN